MRRPLTRRWWLASLLGLLVVGGEPSPGQSPLTSKVGPPASAFDPRLAAIRRASASWESRQGPARAVVDQVCLVADLPSFLAAVASWDRERYFPVLFDDVESSFRFIRAFRPARIVRWPSQAAPIAPGRAWDRALDAVEASWADSGHRGAKRPRGDAVDKSLGPTPPGVVIASGTAPMLAGAVALAAGRFQPLIRLESARRFADVLTLDEADAFGHDVEREVGRRLPDHRGLGDDCDFLTLAGDYPFRYREAGGDSNAVDDRIGRIGDSGERWAYAGRLLGDAAESAYRAMCSLFLQPDSALLFNGYDEDVSPWSLYSMRTAAVRLSARLPTSHVAGASLASLGGWHETFDPTNRFGLVVMNSHGSPVEFNIRGGPAHAPDIPLGVPSAVLMIHSFSCAEPGDPATIAGRWLANGAFVFFGSMNEPYLDSFRKPLLVTELIGLKLPLVVVERQGLGESRGNPWRLVFLGDPLYRIDPERARNPLARVKPRGDSARWPSYEESPRPTTGDDFARLAWTLKTALARLREGQSGAMQGPEAGDVLVAEILGIRREALPAESRRILDALAVEVLLAAKRRTALRGYLLGLPEPERATSSRRAIETLLTADFHANLARQDAARVRADWIELMKLDAPVAFKKGATSRAGRLATTADQIAAWMATLDDASRTLPITVEAEVIAPERTRILEARKSRR